MLAQCSRTHKPTHTQVRLPECCLAERFMTFNMQGCWEVVNQAHTYTRTHSPAVHWGITFGESHTHMKYEDVFPARMVTDSSEHTTHRSQQRTLSPHIINTSCCVPLGLRRLGTPSQERDRTSDRVLGQKGAIIVCVCVCVCLKIVKMLWLVR